MILWSLCVLFFFLGFGLLFPELRIDRALAGSRRELRELALVGMRLREVEDALLAGVVPSQEKWDALATLPEPWGSLAHSSVTELRRQGGALSPTLRRLRLLAQEHGADLADARARSSQAFAQAGVCLLLIPVFSVLLAEIMPGVDRARTEWFAATAFAFALGLAGATWMVRIADSARWGGLRPITRPWVLAAYCAIERFLALLRTGAPADVAWVQACAFLAQGAPVLAAEWGSSVWTARDLAAPPGRNPGGAAEPLYRAGETVRKAAQLSLLEGRACTDRVETALQSLRLEMKSQVNRELTLLTTRVLKPLFLFVTPAILGLLAYGLWIAWREAL